MGLDEGAVQRLLERAEQEVREGKLPSCQLAIACDDQITTATFGDAGDDHRYVVFSITKALVAGAVWVLLGDGSLAPSTRVADLVGEFGTNGKHTVTVEHLLTHTAGFPRAPMRPEEGATCAGRLARFAQWRLDWPPGTRTAYHASSAHWVLAELIERAGGCDYRDFVRDRVTAPLGLTRLQLGPRPVDQADILDIAVVGDPPAEQPGFNLDALLAETAPARLRRYNDPEVRAAGVPGAGAVGTAADVARFFQALLHNHAGIWDGDVLADATGNIRNSMLDPITGIPVNRTLGLVVAGDDGKAWMREVGRTVGPRTFAASGIGGQIAWADPDSGLSFCFLTNGVAADVVDAFLRSSALCDLAGRCAAPPGARR